MKKLLTITSITLLTLSLTSCSVFMAAKGGGTEMGQVQKCATRSSITNLGGELISSTVEQGQTVEVYRFRKSTGSAGRAMMHGLLDVSTLGLWEVVGTPMEGHYGKDEHFTLKFTFDAVGNVVKKELL